MDITNNDNPDYNVPHMSFELAEHLKQEFSADKQLTDGLLSDPNVVRSEAYLLGFLAGLGYSQSVVNTIIANQDGQFADVVDVTDNFLDN